jgi:hypothetical protein
MNKSTKNPALSETVANSDVESRTPKPRRGSDTDWLTGSKIREKASLPVARPLDEPLSLPAKPGSVNAGKSTGGGPNSLSSGILKSAGQKSKRAKSYQPPKWIWAIIGGMTVIGVLLVILILNLPPKRPVHSPGPQTHDTGNAPLRSSDGVHK